MCSNSYQYTAYLFKLQQLQYMNKGYVLKAYLQLLVVQLAYLFLLQQLQYMNKGYVLY